MSGLNIRNDDTRYLCETLMHYILSNGIIIAFVGKRYYTNLLLDNSRTEKGISPLFNTVLKGQY